MVFYYLMLVVGFLREATLILVEGPEYRSNYLPACPCPNPLGNFYLKLRDNDAGFFGVCDMLPCKTGFYQVLLKL